ncbi:MAG TPA: response regulator [Gemmatimonadales bacterium]|jgi:PAS domain S-box-containing protein|nr:response regulator [Gemmatimonadales bacterium]
MEAVRVLMVEDDDNDAALIQRELARLTPAPTVQRVSTESALVAALESFAPHLVLCDHNLSGFAGWKALELVRRTQPDLPFILVTGSLDEETAVKYLKGGASDYILKDRLGRLGPAVLEALERARQRQALHRHERLLRQIIDANPSLIFVKDWDGRFVLVNQASAEIYGTTVESMLGKTDADFNPNADEVVHFLRDDREVMSSGRAKFIAEEPVTNPDTKQTRWFQTIKVPLRMPGEERATMLGVATEITERKRLEEQLRQSQKMEAIGQLAGGVAHDFNNILTAIVGYTDLLAAEFGGNERQLEDLEEIRKAARRAAALTRQLLAFSRKQVLEPRIIDLNSVVLNLDKMLRSLISENIDLKTDLATNLAAARADPNQIEQVIMNLAINARDAMPEGGTLTIETSNATLDHAYAAQHVSVVPGDYVMLAVTDTGSGMDESTKARIFEPFFTTKPAGRGTGLGLSTVYGIVKQSGGNIWLYSEPGKGSTFKIYLPAIEALPQDIGKADPVEASRRGGGTILVVEDDEQLRRLTHRALAGRGYTVLEADRGSTALDIARRHKGTIDLLLTDVIMPDTNGRKLADTIRAARPGLRVLYMSGYPDGAIGNHGMLEPGVAYLAKPFTTEAIIRKVREVLEAP